MRRVKFKVVSVINGGERCSAFAKGIYNLFYPKGTTVTAREESLGVAVFKTKRQAKTFIEGARRDLPLKIIRVRPVGRGKIVDNIAAAGGSYTLKLFYRESGYLYKVKPPLGTVFYPAVEVLD